MSEMRRRKSVSIVLIAVGVVLLVLGAAVHVQPIHQGSDQAIVREPEPVLIREITVGGLVRNEMGELQRTYGDAPPDLCPT